MKLLYIKNIPLFLCCLFALSATAQISVSGTVQDGTNNEPLIGATILIKGTSIGTSTDYDGTFTINANSPNDTLEIAYVGYADYLFPLDGQIQVIIDMGVAANDLDEVVVVGYGTQKKREVTGATSKVSAEEIKKTPILRIEQALQGRTPGVQVTNTSGQPGEEPTVRVRGTGTTGNARPLYVVDGLVLNGGIDFLNPGDIESIDVLRDASTAGIYGARAANGVILITTKSGKQGRLSLNYSNYYGLQNATKKIDMLNADEYRILMNEGARNAGLSEPFDLNEIPANDTDWQKALFMKNAPMVNHQIGFSGGNEKSSFASSFSYFSQQGIIGGPKSQFDRFTARLNSNHEVKPFLRVGNNITYTHLVRRAVGSNTSFNGPFSSALNMDPLTPVFETDADKLGQYPYNAEPVVEDDNDNLYGISELLVGGEVVNPLALLETNTAETRVDKIVGNVYAELEPIKGLKARTSFGIDHAFVLNDSYRPLFFLNGAQNNTIKTSVNKGIDRYFTWQWENTLSYEKQFDQHKVAALVGTTARVNSFENLTGFNADVPILDPDNVYLNQAQDTVWMASGGASRGAIASVFGRLTYNFANKYTLTGVVRRDGSHIFGPDNRFGIFPSVGAAWILSDEPFMKSLPFLESLKVHASWGVNGNDRIAPFAFLSTLDQTRRYTFGSGSVIGISPFSLENPEVKWESTSQTSIGFDAGLFKNRLQVTADYFIKNTEGLLERISIPSHVGNVGPFVNAGSVRNSGVELSLLWKNASGKWRYDIGVNGAYNINEMTFIANDEKVINGASWAIAGTVTRAQEGLPIAYFWGYQTAGVFQNDSEVFSHINSDGQLLQPQAVPGDVRFVDVNGDGTIDADDRTVIGNPTPDWTFGLTNNISYGDFDFSMFWQGAAGNQIFNGTQRQDLRYTNRTTKILERWTGEGTSNSIPRYTWIDTNNNYRVSDLYIEDGSYLRLKNLQLGYNFQPSFLEKLKATQWRVYVSAENLLTITNYTGVDPEIGAQSSFDIGIDRAVYPQARTYRIGTSITF